jgi:hypothetical protein
VRGTVEVTAGPTATGALGPIVEVEPEAAGSGALNPFSTRSPAERWRTRFLPTEKGLLA